MQILDLAETQVILKAALIPIRFSSKLTPENNSVMQLARSQQSLGFETALTTMLFLPSKSRAQPQLLLTLHLTQAMMLKKIKMI